MADARTKYDIPYHLIPELKQLAARVAGVPMEALASSSATIDGIRARAALAAALWYSNHRRDDIADALGYDCTSMARLLQRWRENEPSKRQATIYTEAKRMIEQDRTAPTTAKPAAVFVQPGVPIPMPMRRRSDPRRLVAEEMRRREASHARLEADGGGLVRWAD